MCFKLKLYNSDVFFFLLFTSEETWTGFFLSLIRNRTNRISVPTLSSHDVSEVIECLGRICKTALQRTSDADFIMLRFILPHLKESVQVLSSFGAKRVQVVCVIYLQQFSTFLNKRLCPRSMIEASA